jgi:hypothetical protein
METLPVQSKSYYVSLPNEIYTIVYYYLKILSEKGNWRRVQSSQSYLCPKRKLVAPVQNANK